MLRGMTGSTQVPDVWYKLVHVWWKIPARDMHVWWKAMSLSQYSVVIELRSQIYLWEVSPIALDGLHFIHSVLRPKNVIATLEALVHEHRMTRKQATILESYLLDMVSKDGTWL